MCMLCNVFSASAVCYFVCVFCSLMTNISLKRSFSWSQPLCLKGVILLKRYFMEQVKERERKKPEIKDFASKCPIGFILNLEVVFQDKTRRLY